MDAEIERLNDGTLMFLPERLNRDPLVLRGLTDTEMRYALACGAASGFLIGIPLAIVSASIAMVPTCVFAMATLALLSGGSVLRRMKRGKPDTWFYRRLEWGLANGLGLYHAALILRSGPWTVRRTRRLRVEGGRR